MVANGVIGVTAQILASSDLPGGSEKPDDKSSISIFQRMARGFKGMKQNFGQLVKNKGTGLMWMLLASSKVAQEFSMQVFKLLLFFIDILLARLFPIINWLLNNLSELINTVRNVIENLEQWFKDVFEPLWAWVRDHAVSIWKGIPALLGWDKKVDATTETEEFLKEKVIGDEVTEEELQTWASDPTDGLIEGGPIDPSTWNAEDTGSGTGTYLKEWEIDEGHNDHWGQEEELSWLYKGGAGTPPGGQIDSALVGPRIGKDIILIDEEFNKDDKQSMYDSFFTWLPTEDGEKFGWDDIQSWIGQTAENYNFSGEDIMRYFFGTWETGAGASGGAGEELMGGILDQMISGDKVGVKDLRDYVPTDSVKGSVETGSSAWGDY